MPNPGDYKVCVLCGHFKFLHSALNGECDACDDPTVPIASKCPGFKDEDSK